MRVNNNQSIIIEKLKQLSLSCHKFLSLHYLGEYKYPIEGYFALYRGAKDYDLYGMLDAVYILYTIGELEKFTSRQSRENWANLILECQDERGWFSYRNLRGHPKEHATAYAIGALRLLEVDKNERYLHKVKRIHELQDLLESKEKTIKWIKRMGFEFSLKKNWGWHYIWRGSHIGGGVPAVIHMLENVIPQWWSKNFSLDLWFNCLFDWLDAHINPKTGFWQRAFWNVFLKKPTIIDLGGAAHFYWIYEARKRSFLYPKQLIYSTISLQKENGFYKGEKPWCIDLDANFCIIRSYNQLNEKDRREVRDLVDRSIYLNFISSIKLMTEHEIDSIYSNTHELPGALIALIESSKLNEFYAELFNNWKHPLDVVAWL